MVVQFKREPARSAIGEQGLMMSDAKNAHDIYLTGLRNQHGVETQAIGTIQNELSYTKAYPELYARMKIDKQRSTTQAARLDELLAKHGTAKSMGKEAVETSSPPSATTPTRSAPTKR